MFSQVKDTFTRERFRLSSSVSKDSANLSIIFVSSRSPVCFALRKIPATEQRDHQGKSPFWNSTRLPARWERAARHARAWKQNWPRSPRALPQFVPLSTSLPTAQADSVLRALWDFLQSRLQGPGNSPAQLPPWSRLG